MLRIVRRAAAVVLMSLPVAGCVYAPYPGYYYATNYDRAWSAAAGAVRDAGVQVASEDFGSGMISGTKDGINVVVSVTRLADGRVRVQFDSKGPTDRDPGLAERFSQAYERRMGR
jgi:hypothetical protein